MSLPPAFLDDLRSRTGLAALIGRKVKLSKAGREHKGCCPFHNEKTPSFYVNEDKGFYHCFGCGAHGDAIGFTMAEEGLTFIEAVRKLAAEAGLTLPERDSNPAEDDRRKTALDAAHAAAAWFQQQLAGLKGADARAYLEKRGVGLSEAIAFGLGFAPDSRSALRTALKGLGNDALLEAGLLIAPEDPGAAPYDRFSGRLIFPIRDSRGRPVGFGGRALASDQQPKYLNSPDGPLFDKGRLLYNLDRAGPSARKCGRLLVVEGYMDVIGLASVGITEVVAPLGTALTEAQLTLAWRLVDEPFLAFDGDAAGQRAALRAATRALPLLQPGKSLRFLTLPPGQDPDDLARQGGAAAIETLLSGAQPLHERLFAAEFAATPTDTPERRAALRARLRAHADAIAHPDVRRGYQEQWRDALDRHFAPRPRPAWQPRKGPWKPPAPPLRAATRAASTSSSERAEAMLLASLAARPDAAALHAEALSALPLSGAPLIAIREALLRGSAPDLTALASVRPLIDPGLPLQDFDARLASALASLAELHHIGAEMQDLRARYAQDDEHVFQVQARLAREHARIKARLLAEATGE
ncbi:DNA primase [Sandaracinobacteroides saxicola]|uniref:DNA primase n=1 Tax=Sandaracinobacteroides saxicola TaxID=2759707 RepID=A0A7G5IDU7_9SPHN|nr:DNA primase [Sandaracinobacteroides saxicola]QMW21539.1 DNA primase [Sandaracinobacteroides saxicola]